MAALIIVNWMKSVTRNSIRNKQTGRPKTHKGSEIILDFATDEYALSAAAQDDSPERTIANG